MLSLKVEISWDLNIQISNFDFKISSVEDLTFKVSNLSRTIEVGNFTLVELCAY